MYIAGFKKLQDVLKNEYNGLDKIGVFYDNLEQQNKYTYLNIQRKLITLDKYPASDAKYGKYYICNNFQAVPNNRNQFLDKLYTNLKTQYFINLNNIDYYRDYFINNVRLQGDNLDRNNYKEFYRNLDYIKYIVNKVIKDYNILIPPPNFTIYNCLIF